VSSFAATASLVVATSQLMAVQDVIGAMRAADLESGDVLTPSGIIEKPEAAPTQDADQYVSRTQSQSPATEIRQVIYTARCPASSVPHPITPHITTRPIPAIVAACDLTPEPTCVSTSPIQPPWKVLPWMDRPHPHFVLVREIKIVAAGSDMSLRGQMIDVVV
jgi:hypothetical protein